jgi:aminomethyltransferase
LSKKTTLHENHRNLKAKFVSFAGWEMPLYYKGIHQEVAAVRKSLGLFDVSHMGRIAITGPDTLSFLEHLSTNTVIDKPFGRAFYTVFCNEKGHAIDDLLVYLIDAKNAFIVINASNRAKDLAHINQQSRHYDVMIQDHFEDEGIISLQGPLVNEVLRDLPSLAPFQFTTHEGGVIVSRTGYTGEDGYEFYGPNLFIKSLWNQLLEKGAQFGIEPCGLGARDILRLEMGYALYGHELSESINPLESVAKWTVHLDAHDFLGKEEMLHEHLRFPVALIGLEKIPAREGYSIFYQGKEIGVITSGAFSPTLNKPIALGLVTEKLPLYMVVDVQIRSVNHPFEVVQLPFVNTPPKRST